MVFEPYFGKYPVGYAYLYYKNNEVSLQDIYIFNFRGKKIGFIYRMINPIYFRNFSSKGIGTTLLNEIIVFCKYHGITKIRGEAAGDVARLKKWYQSFGFTVDENNIVELKLK